MVKKTAEVTVRILDKWGRRENYTDKRGERSHAKALADLKAYCRKQPGFKKILPQLITPKEAAKKYLKHPATGHSKDELRYDPVYNAFLAGVRWARKQNKY